jgi:hypothetical protein
LPEEEPEELLLTYHDPHHAAAIFAAISEWARFEYAIDKLIWELARLEEQQGACLTAQFSNAAARIDALIALARVQGISATLIAKLNGIRHDMFGLREQRNRFVHDPWFCAHPSQQHYRLELTAKAKLVHAYKPVSEDEAKSVCSNIEALNRRFEEIRSEIVHEFYSL